MFTSFGRTDEKLSSLCLKTWAGICVELWEGRECNDNDDDGDGIVEIGEEEMEISPMLFSFLRVRESDLFTSVFIINLDLGHLDYLQIWII